MMFQEFIIELGKHMGVETGADTGAGPLYRISLPDKAEITLESLDSGTQLALSALLCRFPPEQERLVLFDRLMQAHAFGLATNGAHFAASARSGKVIMAKVLNLEQNSSFESLLEELDGFISQYQAWKEEYDAGRLCQEDAAEAVDESASGRQFA